MDTETELKLFIEKTQHSAFIEMMNSHPALVKRSERQLTNVYFDTPDKTLRKLDFGLRVRTCEGRSEQTLKAAGKVTGGLHARPEYNVEVEGHRPDLALFDPAVWPEHIVLDELQSALNPLFSNLFLRRIWLVQLEDTLIEVALDVGTLEAGEATADISEVELELIKGHNRHLFELAQHILCHCPVRLGQASKAKRGYRLASGVSPAPLIELKPYTLAQDSTIEDALPQLVSGALSHIQLNEQAFIDSHDFRAIQEVEKGWQLLVTLQQYFAEVVDDTFCELVDTTLPWQRELTWLDDEAARQQIIHHDDQYLKRLDDKRRLLRAIEKVDHSEHYQQVEALFHSQPYNRWLLQLSEWLVAQGWRVRDSDKRILNQGIRTLAQRSLNECWSTVDRLFGAGKTASVENYVRNIHELEAALLSGICFRRYFEPEATKGYRGPWFDMLHGCLELSLLSFIEKCGEPLELKDREAFERWLTRKRKSWLELLEQTRDTALKMEPYW